MKERKRLLAIGISILMFTALLDARPIRITKRGGNDGKFDYVYLYDSPDLLIIKCLNPGNILCYDFGGSPVAPINSARNVDLDSIDNLISSELENGRSTGQLNFQDLWIKWQFTEGLEDDWRMEIVIAESYEEMLNTPW